MSKFFGQRVYYIWDISKYCIYIVDENNELHKFEWVSTPYSASQFYIGRAVNDSYFN